MRKRLSFCSSKSRPGDRRAQGAAREARRPRRAQGAAREARRPRRAQGAAREARRARRAQGAAWEARRPRGAQGTAREARRPRRAQGAAPWLPLDPRGSSWLPLAPPGSSWLLLAAPGSSWLLLAAPRRTQGAARKARRRGVIDGPEAPREQLGRPGGPGEGKIARAIPRSHFNIPLDLLPFLAFP